jgi:parallel beta-helix repeat protein
MEFDHNIIEYNEIGVKVSDASTVRITNNTITDGDYGIYIENASPWIYENIIENNRIGIYCLYSNSTVESNDINNTGYGIYSSDSSPNLIKNEIKENREPAIFVERADIIIIAYNAVDKIVIQNSTVEELFLINTEATIINSTVLSLDYDTQSRLIIKWFLRIRVEDSKGHIVKNATVNIQDTFGSENAVLQTDSEGWTYSIALIEFILDVNGQTYYTPHMILAEKEGASGEETVTLNKDMSLEVTLKQSTLGTGGEFPWFFLLVIGSVSAVGVGCLLGTEIGKLSLLSLFIPLYMKLKKEKVLDHYNRGRVYQFIELNPGEHYNSIKKAFDMNSGTLTYHLYVLEKAEKIKSRKDGIYKRFYPKKATIPQNNGGVLTEIQKRIVNSIRDLPGATQKELASVMGLRQSTLSYQLTKLDTKGVIRTARKGKHTCYYPKS